MSTTMQRENAFRAWRDNGFTDLIPVVPPNAELSANSYIAKNNSAGKAPGIRYPSSLWGGLKHWHEIEATDEDIANWHAMGASVGLRRGKAFLLDIDAYDAATADMIEQTAIEMLGPAPCRVGMHPKRALLYRAEGHIGGAKLSFDGDPPGQIEIPGQAVVFGIHKSTGKPYAWPRKPTHIDKLTGVTPDRLNLFFERMRSVLPKAKRMDQSSLTDRATVNQATLAGDPIIVAEAVRRLPNTRETFPTYEDMIKVGEAISGALPNDRQLAADLFHEWCSKWDGNDYDHDLTEARWRRINPPHAIGASFLFEQADRLAPLEHGHSFVAMSWFEDLTTKPEDPFDIAAAKAEQKEKVADIYPTLSVGELINRPPPEWLIKRHLPREGTGFIYAAPGVGKTFLALDMMLTITAGLDDWNGDPIVAPRDGFILYIAAEGSFGFRNRIKAWMKDRDVSADALSRFRLIEKTINFMAKDDKERLARTVRAVSNEVSGPLIAVVVDTVSRAIPGADENLQKDMSLFISACDDVHKEFHCVVIGVHHAGKNGDMRGSTAIPGGGDFIFKLDRKKGASVGQLYCEKMKEGPDGWSDNYAFSHVALDGEDASLVVSRVDHGVGPSAKVTPGTTESVLRAMMAAWDAGEPWAKSAQSKERYAVRRMVLDFGFEGVVAEQTLGVWEASGLIVHEMRDKRSKRSGFKVAVDPGQFVRNEGLFD